MEYKVSIVIPVYNVDKYLRKCLKSIVDQTYLNWEAIIVDDGSTDTSGRVCDEFAHCDKRIKVIHKKNEGLMAAWITGLKETNCDFIMFVDSDDYISCNMLEIMINEQQKNNSDIVVCNKTSFNQTNYVRTTMHYKSGYYSESEIKKEIYPTMINTGKFQSRGMPMSRWGKLIRKKILLNNLKYCNTSISYGEDLNIMIPVFCDCNSISIVDMESSDYFYRMNPDSILHTYKKEMFTKTKILYSKVEEAVKEKNKEFLIEQLDADYLAAMVQCFKNEIISIDSSKQIINNLDDICSDNKFKQMVKKVKWNKYDISNKLIIYIMKYWKFVAKGSIVKILKKAKSR